MGGDWNVTYSLAVCLLTSAPPVVRCSLFSPASQESDSVTSPSVPGAWPGHPQYWHFPHSKLDALNHISKEVGSEVKLYKTDDS